MYTLNLVSNKHRKPKYLPGESLAVKVVVSANDFKPGYKMCGHKVIKTKNGHSWATYKPTPGKPRPCWSGLYRSRKL